MNTLNNNIRIREKTPEKVKSLGSFSKQAMSNLLTENSKKRIINVNKLTNKQFNKIITSMAKGESVDSVKHCDYRPKKKPIKIQRATAS